MCFKRLFRRKNKEKTVNTFTFEPGETITKETEDILNKIETPDKFETVNSEEDLKSEQGLKCNDINTMSNFTLYVSLAEEGIKYL